MLLFQELKEDHAKISNKDKIMLSSQPNTKRVDSQSPPKEISQSDQTLAFHLSS